MRKATVEAKPVRTYMQRPTLDTEFVADDEEHWLEVNARPHDRPPRNTEESGSRWWE